MARMSKEELAEAQELILSACTSWSTKRELQEAASHLLSKSQFDRMIERLKAEGRIERKGHSIKARWRAMKSNGRKRLADAAVKSNGRNGLADDIYAKISGGDEALVESFILSIAKYGSIRKAKIAFDAAVAKLEVLGG